jgi:hypothetical protein
LQLYAIFAAAGLEASSVRLDGAVFGGCDVAGLAWLAETVRSMLPVIEHLGIARADEVDIETVTRARVCWQHRRRRQLHQRARGTGPELRLGEGVQQPGSSPVLENVTPSDDR